MNEQPEPGVNMSESMRRAVESGRDVAASVRDMVISLLQNPSESLQSVRTSVQQMMATAEDVARRSAPANPDSVLRQVIDGVASGVQTVAQTTGYAVEEAKARGQRFAGDDLNFAARNLKAAGEILVETVKYATERTSTETRTTASEVRTHAERMMASVRPNVVAAMNAVRESPLQLASEATGTALRGGRLAAGALLGMASEMLSGAASLLDPDRASERPGTSTTPEAPGSSAPAPAASATTPPSADNPSASSGRAAGSGWAP